MRPVVAVQQEQRRLDRLDEVVRDREDAARIEQVVPVRVDRLRREVGAVAMRFSPQGRHIFGPK
jgi:hypothetical protein